MSKLSDISGHMRAAVVFGAFQECVACGEKPTPQTLGARLPEARFPNIGTIGEDEIAAAQELFEELAEQNVARLEAEAGSSTNGTVSAVDETAAAQIETAVSNIDPAEALERRRLAHVALANARASVLTMTNRRNAARTALSEAIQFWQTGLPKQSRRDALMDVVKTQQIVRAQNNGKVRGRPGPSAYDQERYFSGPAYGDARDFVRAQQKHGGNRRGALPLKYARGPVDTGGVSKMPLPRTNSGNNRG